MCSNCYICEMLYGAMRSDEVKRDNPINAGERSLRCHPHRGTRMSHEYPIHNRRKRQIQFILCSSVVVTLVESRTRIQDSDTYIRDLNNVVQIKTVCKHRCRFAVLGRFCDSCREEYPWTVIGLPRQSPIYFIALFPPNFIWLRSTHRLNNHQ